MAKKDEKKVCFVISPIGDDDSETRKRSDQVLKHIITGPVEGLGYEVIRADKISEPGIITSQIIEYIVDADLVVADLTEKNPNVFYELALRHAARKPLVQLIIKGEAIPFDVAATRIIQFDLHNLDSVDAAKAELTAQVNALEADNNDMHNPVSVSLDLKMLKASGNPEERSLADIVEAISDLRLTITSSAEKGSPSSKLLQEIRIMLEEFPSRMDVDLKRRRRRLHPMIIHELLDRPGSRNEPIAILMAASIFRDDLPWLYELAKESYQAIKSGKIAAIQKERDRLRKLSNLKRPLMLMEEFGIRDDELHMMSHEFPHILEHFLSRVIDERKTPRMKKVPELLPEDTDIDG